jgi:hypothetical protein
VCFRFFCFICVWFCCCNNIFAAILPSISFYFWHILACLHTNISENWNPKVVCAIPLVISVGCLSRYVSASLGSTQVKVHNFGA